MVRDYGDRMLWLELEVKKGCSEEVIFKLKQRVRGVNKGWQTKRTLCLKATKTEEIGQGKGTLKVKEREVQKEAWEIGSARRSC